MSTEGFGQAAWSPCACTLSINIPSSCTDLVAVDDVDERLLQRHLADAAHVEAVDVVPPVDLVVLVLAVLDGSHVERRLVREHEAVGRQPLVPGEQNCNNGGEESCNSWLIYPHLCHYRMVQLVE